MMLLGGSWDRVKAYPTWLCILLLLQWWQDTKYLISFYLLFLSSSSSSSSIQGQLPRSRRDVPLLVEEREIELRQAQPNNNNNSSSGSCDIGGALPQFNTSTPCLLFCLSYVTLNITVEGSDPVECSLGPQQYRDLNFTCDDMNVT